VYSFLCVPRHFFRIELTERTTITSPFFEDDRPAESGLRPFEHEEFEVCAVILDGHTPFAIVILEHQWIVLAGPGASFRHRELQVSGHQPHESRTCVGEYGAISRSARSATVGLWFFISMTILPRTTVLRG
jgi:hypothetical protein